MQGSSRTTRCRHSWTARPYTAKRSNREGGWQGERKLSAIVAGVKAARKTADEFVQAGWIAYSLDGKTPQSERDSVMKQFRNGDITILCNADLFGEGLDVPDCECVCLLRPTKSLTLHIQQSMRSMRYMDGKTAIILDFVQNCRRHGLPDDPREWSLEPKKKQENMVKIRECKRVFLQSIPHCRPLPDMRSGSHTRQGQ